MSGHEVGATDYKDRFYQSYYTSHIVGREGPATLAQFRRRAQVYRAQWQHLLPDDRSARILDVGCGNGSLVWWLQQRGYTHAAGIDVSPDQIEAGQRLGIQRVERADLRTYLAARPGEFDCLVLRDIVEHFERPAILEVLDLCRAALRPGGRVIVQVPNAEAPFWGRIRYGDFTHELAFTEGSLRQVFAVTGFERPSFHPAGPVLQRLKDVPRYALWRCLEALYKLLIFAETGRRWAIVTESIIAVAVRSEARE